MDPVRRVVYFFSCFLKHISSLTRKFALSVCVFAHMAACGGVAWAFDPEMPGYIHHVWTIEHGLPQNIVSYLLASRDGYLWFGAGSGIVRFDGLTFKTFDLTNTPALRSNRVGALYEGVDGTLWVGTSKGLVRYRDGQFTAEAGDGRFADESITMIAGSADGQLFAGSLHHLYRRGTNGRWSLVPIEGIADPMVSLLPAPNGSMWIAAGRHVIEWRGRIVRTISLGGADSQTFVTTLREDRDGRIWVGTNRGLARLDPSTGAIAFETGALARLYVRRLLIDRDGDLWVGAQGQLARRAATGQVTLGVVADPEDESGVTGIPALVQDTSGQIWYGRDGGAGGLHRLAPRRLSEYTRRQGLPCDNVGAVTVGADETIWLSTLCADGAGLVALKDDRIRNYAREPGAPKFISALLTLPDGELLIGTFHGELMRFAGGRFTPVPGPPRPRPSAINALFRDGRGALWVGTDAGLSRNHDGQWRTWRAEDGLGSADVRTIVGARDGSIWIGGGLGVARYRNGRFEFYGQAHGVPAGEVRALYVDGDDALWIGTYGGGLARWKDGRITRYGTYDGLLDASVHRIIEDARGDFWLTGDRGIRRVSRRELTAIANGEGRSPHVEIFDNADGMTNAECNGMAQPAGVQGPNGTLWFPSQGGLIRMDPAIARLDVPAPAVEIESVRADGVEQPRGPAIVIPPGVRELEIRYTAPSFVRPEQLQFRYRLRGHADVWTDSGTRRVASFANLAPGRYEFEVTARSHAGAWSNTGARVHLELQPYLYQRLAFKVAMIVALVLSIAAGFRLRLRQVGRRAQALEAVVAERTRELSEEREGLKAAKADVEASHTRLLTTFNQLRVGVILVDADGCVRFLSEAMHPLMGGKRLDDLIGQPLERILPIAQESLAAIRAQIRAPQRGVRITAEFAPDPGQRFWTEIEIHSHVNDSRQRVLHLYDVTETFDLKRTLQTGPAGVGAKLLGESVGMRNLRAEIATVATLDATVLIEGETGTGKELVARAIHAGSRRKERPFVAINCAGLTESLLASQLFGHRRGAFTGAISDHVGLFEAAQGGTLLLDEIGDMPMGVQTHLLRVLEEREILRLGESKPRPIDVRLLAATHRDLDADVKNGRFREDLLYRIRVVRLRLPPLRLRTGDIPLLAATMLRKAQETHGLPVESISREVMEYLTAQRWPGNVRQLKAAIEGAAIRSTGPVLKLSDVLAELPADAAPAPPTSGLPDRERSQLIAALQQTGGNRAAAVRLLGWPRSTFYHRLSRLQAEGLDGQGDSSSSSLSSSD
jgi:DNA-binding NtrC family response regulator/ligand-binding sensor domain-containing protein